MSGEGDFRRGRCACGVRRVHREERCVLPKMTKGRHWMPTLCERFRCSLERLFLFCLPAALTFFNRRMGRREAGNRHSIRAATDIVQSDAMAELDGFWIAAVFAADAALEVFADAAAFGD